MKFYPSIAVKDWQEKPEGDISWLLDHWYWPFTDHPLAKWLVERYDDYLN